MLELESLKLSSSTPGVISVLYSLLVSFLLTSVIAWTYEKTFQGLSYSRNFVQSLVMVSLVVTIAMLAIGDSLARGIGMMGALAIIRFRSSVRDPRDMVFIFACVAVGMATGVSAFPVAILGAIAFCLTAFFLHRAPLGSRDVREGILRFSLSKEELQGSDLQEALRAHCKELQLVSIRDQSQGSRFDHSYQVKLKSGGTEEQILSRLQEFKSLRDLSFIVQEPNCPI